MKLTIFMKQMCLLLMVAIICQEAVAADDGVAPPPAANARQADPFLQSLQIIPSTAPGDQSGGFLFHEGDIFVLVFHV